MLLLNEEVPIEVVDTLPADGSQYPLVRYDGKEWLWNTISKKPYDGVSFSPTASALSSTTWIYSVRLPSLNNPVSIRFKFNNQTGSEITIRAFIALSNSENDGIPSVGTEITGDASTGFKELHTAGSQNIVIPANSDVLTEPETINLIPALDGNSPILIMSTFGAINGVGYLADASDGNTYIGVKAFSGDGVLGSGGVLTNLFVFIGYELSEPIPNCVKKIKAFGDSITANYTTGWFSLSGIGDDVVSVNLAVPGKTPSQIRDSLINDSDVASIAIYSAYTPNGAWSSMGQSEYDTLKGNFDSAYSYCLKNKILMIPSMIAPNDNYDLASDNKRKSFFAYVLSRTGILLNLIDTLGTGNSPDRYKLEYHADGIHMNAAGVSACKSVYNAFITDLLGKNGLWVPLS